MPRNRPEEARWMASAASPVVGSGRRPTALYARHKPATGEGADTRPADVQQRKRFENEHGARSKSEPFRG